MSNEVTLGRFVQELVKKYQNKDYDNSVITKSITGLGETSGTPADGAYLVSYDIVREIIESAQQGSVLYRKAKKIPCPKYGLRMPFINETARTYATSSGLRAYFVGEGEQKTISHAHFDVRDFKLQKLVIRIPATWEILEDVEALDGFLTAFAGEKLSWYIDWAMLYGTSKVEGIYSDSANGVIGAASADPLTLTVLKNFEKKLSPANEKAAEWYFSKENWNDIIDLITEIASNDVTGINGANWFTWGADGEAYIFGHKCNILEQMTSTLGDIVLGDFSQYMITETEFKKNISVGFRYNYNEEELLMEVRFTGCSFGNVYSLGDGSEVAPFVIAEGKGPSVSSSSSTESGGNVSTSSYSSESSVDSSSESSGSSDSDSSFSYLSQTSQSSGDKSGSSLSSKSDSSQSNSSASSEGLTSESSSSSEIESRSSISSKSSNSSNG